MKEFYKKIPQVLATLLMLFSVFLPLLSSTARVHANELSSGQYQLSTVVTINNNQLKSTGYGEGKFYIAPTYSFADSVTLKNGDTLVYDVPKEFKIEQQSTQEIKAPSGENIATLTTDPSTNKATITVTNAEYFAKLTEKKSISALFTVVWADNMPYNQERTVAFPGGETYQLKRIKVDEEPQGYSKWGVQDSKDPRYINWRIRVNRDVTDMGNVVIKDIIPDGQKLDGTITGYHFTDWDSPQGVRTSFNPADVVTVTDSNNFTINAGDLNKRGIFIIYRTLITKPVDKVEKKAFNDVTVTANGTQLPALTSRPFAPLTVTDGIGEATEPDEVAFTVQKELVGRNLNDGEFTFDLLNADANNQVLETTQNKNGSVTFKAIKFLKEGTYNYIIREHSSNVPGVVDDENKDITVTVQVVNNNGVAKANVTYSRTKFTNRYTVTPAKVTLSASKELSGKTLTDNQFTFLLTDLQSNAVTEAKNKADGSVTFPELTFDQAGTYKYTLSEKNEAQQGYTYDSKSVEATVVVTDNGQGQLIAETTYGNGLGATPPTFSNAYHDYGTSYEFTSSNATPLPDEVKQLLPTDATRYNSGQEVTATQPQQTSVTLKDGIWTFDGYTPSNKQTVTDKDLVFVGTWTFKPVSKSSVTYDFTNVDPNSPALPEAVRKLIPSDTKQYAIGDPIKAILPPVTSVSVDNGVWTFVSYDTDNKTFTGDNVHFVGTWKFTPKANMDISDPTTPSQITDASVQVKEASKKVLPRTNSTTSFAAIITGVLLLLFATLILVRKKLFKSNN